jgi:hypothetical protein
MEWSNCNCEEIKNKVSRGSSLISLTKRRSEAFVDIGEWLSPEWLRYQFSTRLCLRGCLFSLKLDKARASIHTVGDE